MGHSASLQYLWTRKSWKLVLLVITGSWCLLQGVGGQWLFAEWTDESPGWAWRACSVGKSNGHLGCTRQLVWDSYSSERGMFKFKNKGGGIAGLAPGPCCLLPLLMKSNGREFMPALQWSSPLFIKSLLFVSSPFLHLHHPVGMGLWIPEDTPRIPLCFPSLVHNRVLRFLK